MEQDISPLFAIEAEELLSNGNPREAAILCTRGLEKYPGYHFAYKILIKSLQKLGDNEKAEEVYNEAPEIVRRDIRSKESDEPGEINESVESIPEEEYHEAIKNDNLDEELINSVVKKEDDTLDVNNEEEIEIDSDSLTLAKIYEQQEAYKDALEIYKKQINKTPDNEFLINKIKELETLLEEIK